MTPLFQSEMAVFEGRLSGWRKSHPEQWVVIYGEDILGPFVHKADAYNAGFDKYGDTHWLLEQIVEEEEVIRVTHVSFRKIV